MKPTTTVVRTFAAMAGALALTVSGCGSSPDDTSGEPASKMSPPSGTAYVKVKKVPGIGRILVNSRGKALYANSADTGTSVECVGECAKEWPPLAVTTKSIPRRMKGIEGAFTVIKRPSGDRQLALDGHPLYTFARDRKPGMVHGNGSVDRHGGTELTWHVVTPTGAVPPPSARPSPTKSPR